MAFVVQKAVREKIYPKIALMSPSGGGKTYSSLRLATGMAEEIKKMTGKEAKILMGNTEGARGRYYANEFKYDIVDLTAPHNPEMYVDFINYAVEEGYDILIIDSSSHEWEGKGGCLELQQQAGGTYQAWGKVTPRHEKFISAIAYSPIALIATMRGKDQYELDTDERGKKTVKKLGVGAKQRDGFEYEFTCTFLIDQKTNTAEAQKDNTHIFENDVATLLSEEHGKKIIKWANSSNIEPKKPVAKLATVPVDDVADNDVEELDILKQEITALAKEKIESGIESDLVYDVIVKHNKKKNPNAIKDIDVAKAVLAEIKELENVEE